MAAREAKPRARVMHQCSWGNCRQRCAITPASRTPACLRPASSGQKPLTRPTRNGVKKAVHARIDGKDRHELGVYVAMRRDGRRQGSPPPGA